MHIFQLSAAIALLSLASTAFADGHCSKGMPGDAIWGSCHFLGIYPERMGKGTPDIKLPCYQYSGCDVFASVCHKITDIPEAEGYARCLNQETEPPREE
ncbi:unnamed protein product [Zymoseptoria tritici ST99CH_1E4]|uniref:Uncharacterized protein n=1 Tax=Zymoseptoria tritici ST99CH_1E4 TaxID=1276532 RepID=A0A2H1H4S9_ZYMTR|nr:unnamed protein product [Zymoseptoria tritici ST99CH_1E4]